jgi:hypothetical protein
MSKKNKIHSQIAARAASPRRRDMIDDWMTDGNPIIEFDPLIKFTK